MKKELTSEQVGLLKKPLPPEAVKPHPTKNYLSSIKAIYVVERLNDVFGIGSWSLESEVIDNKTAMIVVKTILTIESYGIKLESYGGNDNGGQGSKNYDAGDAYKGAVTDALTKICSYLEIGMDVFKGLKDAPKQHEPAKTPVKAELTPKHAKWNDVKRKVSEGVAISEVEKAFSLSEENKNLLINA